MCVKHAGDSFYQRGTHVEPKKKNLARISFIN